jgi:hypothetical protein
MDANYLKLRFDYSDGVLYWKTSFHSRLIGMPAGVVNKEGYVRIGLDGKPYLRHRLIFAWHHGRWPTNEIDHIDRDRSNDRIENLREATRGQNMWNKGAKGYSWNRQNKKWMAQLSANGKRFFIGTYDTENEAHAAYLEAKKVHHQ